MRRITFTSCLAVVIALFVVPITAVQADARGDARVICGGGHTSKTQTAEMFDSTVSIRNANLEHPADVRITRLTIRDFFGNVVGDFGDAATPAGPIPTNKDIPPSFDFDVTTVPPGASYYLTTTNIYGNNFLPSLPGGGNNISIALEFTTTGDPELVVIGGSLRVRELLGGVGGTQGQEHARLGITCQRLK
jgi:hypothetical protein